jgi:hypothetical protein
MDGIHFVRPLDHYMQGWTIMNPSTQQLHPWSNHLLPFLRIETLSDSNLPYIGHEGAVGVLFQSRLAEVENVCH